jgi:hypothetical protein
MPSNSYDSAGQQENGNGNDHHAICLAADKTTIPSQPTPSPMVRDAGGKLDTDGANMDLLTGSISGDSSGADSDDSRSDLDGNPAHSPSCPSNRHGIYPMAQHHSPPPNYQDVPVFRVGRFGKKRRWYGSFGYESIKVYRQKK